MSVFKHLIVLEIFAVYELKIVLDGVKMGLKTPAFGKNMSLLAPFKPKFKSYRYRVRVIRYTSKGLITWAAPSEFGTYRLCEQRRFRRACASAQSRQNLRCSLIQAVSQEEPSDRKPDPWPLWMAGHAQLKFVMTECSKTQIRLTGLTCVSGYCH